jgi:hypothetical protein
MNQLFLEPKFTGSRFYEHSVPLELLKDLAVLEEMIIEVAKWKFLQANPDRKRSPRRFTEGLELHLQTVEKGSAKLVITFVFSTLFPSASADYLEKAKESIIAAINAAGQSQSVIDYLPVDLLGYFDRFGRGLREGEAIELSSNSGYVARLTPQSRRTLILASSQIQEWTDEMPLRGAICDANKRTNTFEIVLPDGGHLQAPMSSQHRTTILEAYDEYEKGTRVLLQGIVKKDRQDRLKSIESVDHISLIDPLDVATRLEALAELEEGWLDGKGHAPDKTQLTWLSTAFDTLYDPTLPLPYLYPTAEGGIQAEWSLGDWEISLEIDLAGQVAEWQALNLNTQECREESLNLTKPEGWQALNQKLQALSAKIA